MEIPRGVVRPPGSTQRLREDALKPRRVAVAVIGFAVFMVTSQMERGSEASWRTVVFWVAALLVGGPLIFWASRREGDRLVQVAGARGFRREPAETLQRPEFAALPLLYKPASRRFNRVVRSRVNDVDVWVFTVSNAESDLAVIAGVVAFDLGTTVFPSFELRPKGIIESGKPIDFPEDPEFAGRWHVTGDDEAAVRRHLSLDVRRLLAQLPEPWWVAASGRWLVVYRQNRYLKIASVASYDWRSFDAVVDTAARIFSAFTGR
jgi:hypothetical protein